MNRPGFQRYACLASILVFFGTNGSRAAASEKIAGSPSPAPASQIANNSKVTILSPQARARRETAYTLMKKQWAFDVELWGTSASDIYGGFGIHYGLGKGFEVGVNLLHLGAGVFNLSTKWNFLDLPQFALGLRFSPMFAHGDWVWIARSSTLVSGLNIWLFPVSLQLSAPILPWLQFDLSTDYVDSLVLGDVDEDSLLLDGTIALRQLAFQPVIRWHLLQRTSFYFQAKLPVITRIPGAISTEAPLVEGVLLGGEAAGRSSIPLKDTYVLTCGARSMIREDIFLDFSVNVGALAKKIYGNPISPRLQLEMRF